MSSIQTELFSVHNLSKVYVLPTGELQVLKEISMSVRAGEMLFILGRSGSGKSTLLHLLGGLDRPSGGSIFFDGENMAEMGDDELSRLRNRRIGFVFQFYHLLPELTLYENVLLPSMIAGTPNKKWAKECLRKVKLYGRADHYPSELSGGERQRGAIARALVNHPSVVLCDEPTGNLDEETAASVISLMEDLYKNEGQSFVIVTHDEALAVRHKKVVRLVDGLIYEKKNHLMDGSPKFSD